MAEDDFQNEECLCCRKKMPSDLPRICPLCEHRFAGNGWDGIDAHWRARHGNIMSYEQFWDALCENHK